MRMLLRLVFFLFLMLACSGIGAAGSSHVSNKKLVRLTEERDGYKALAEKAMMMSEKSLVFAQGYQEVLILCGVRLNTVSTFEQVEVSVPRKKGGIGGPVILRKQSLLP